MKLLPKPYRVASQRLSHCLVLSLDCPLLIRLAFPSVLESLKYLPFNLNLIQFRILLPLFDQISFDNYSISFYCLFISFNERLDVAYNTKSNKMYGI